MRRRADGSALSTSAPASGLPRDNDGVLMSSRRVRCEWAACGCNAVPGPLRQTVLDTDRDPTGTRTFLDSGVSYVS